jgi:hypothetical protein
MRTRHLFILTLILAVALMAPAALQADDATSADKAEKAEKAKAEKTEDEKAKAAREKLEREKLEAILKAVQEYVPESHSNGALFIGGYHNTNDGSLAKTGEYNVLPDGALPSLSGTVWGNGGRNFYLIEGKFKGDSADQRYYFDADLGRRVELQAGYRALPHRLIHDPLSYLDASVSNFVIRHDDEDPDAEFDLKYADLDASASIRVPGAEALSFNVGYHRLTRDGVHQGITASKCSNCHVSGKVVPMDQATDDVNIGALLELTNVSLEYAFRHRSFSERADTLTHTFDDPLHPASLAPVFGNRISYWSTDGEQPILQVPDKTKQSHMLKVTGRLPQKLSVQGVFNYIDLTNDTTGVGSKSKGLKGRVALPIMSKATLSATVRYYTVDVDDIFVDIKEPVSLAGPTAGQTYAEFYPDFGSPDFLRRSVRSRSPLNFDLAFAWRPLKGTNLLVGYEREQLERDHFEVEETTSDLIKVNLRSRFVKGVQFRFRWEEAWIDDPFTGIHAAIPAVVQPGPSPGALPFYGLQYYGMYDARQANLTSFADRKRLVDPRLTWSPNARTSFTFNYRYRDLSNSSLNFSDWSRTMHSPSFSFWYAASNYLQITTGYNYLQDKASTLLTVLAFDG